MQGLLPLDGAIFWETGAAKRLYDFGDTVYKKGCLEYTSLQNVTQKLFIAPAGDVRLTNSLQGQEGWTKIIDALAESFFKNVLDTRKKDNTAYDIGRYSRLSALWYLMKSKILVKSPGNYLNDLELSLKKAYQKQSWKDKVKILWVLQGAVELCASLGGAGDSLLEDLLEKDFKSLAQALKNLNNKEFKDLISKSTIAVQKKINQNEVFDADEKKILTLLMQRIALDGISPLLVFSKDTEVYLDKDRTIVLTDCVETFFRNLLNNRLYLAGAGLSDAHIRLEKLFPNVQHELLDYYKTYNRFVVDKNHPEKLIQQDKKAHSDWALLFCNIPGVVYTKENCCVSATVKNILVIANHLFGLGWPSMPVDPSDEVIYIKKYLPELLEYFGESNFLYQDIENVDQDFTIPVKTASGSTFTIFLTTRRGMSPGHIYITYDQELDLKPNVALSEDLFAQYNSLYFLIHPKYWMSVPKNLLPLFAFPIKDPSFIANTLAEVLSSISENWLLFFIDILNRDGISSNISVESARLKLYRKALESDKKQFKKKQLESALICAEKAFDQPDTFVGAVSQAPYVAQDFFNVLLKDSLEDVVDIALRSAIVGLNSKSYSAREAALLLFDDLFRYKKGEEEGFDLAKRAFEKGDKETTSLRSSIKLLKLLINNGSHVAAIENLAEHVNNTGNQTQKAFIRQVTQYLSR